MASAQTDASRRVERFAVRPLPSSAPSPASDERRKFESFRVYQIKDNKMKVITVKYYCDRCNKRILRNPNELYWVHLDEDMDLDHYAIHYDADGDEYI